MNQETINPIRHGAISTASGTALGAVGGGIKTGAKTWMYTALGFAALGAVVMSGGTMLGLLGVSAATTGTVSTLLGQTLLGGTLGGLFGGLVAGPITGGLGGIVGTVKGGSNAASRIRDEKGAANMMDAQLQAYQAQAMAMQAQPTTIYAPSASNANRYETASTRNEAPLSIQGGTGQNLGTINGKQLALA